MATYPIALHKICLLPIGVITQQLPGDPSPIKYVYQRVGKDFGNIPSYHPHGMQVRKWVSGTDPATAPQLVRRAVFADAVVEWNLLTPGGKAVYNFRARPKKISGWNLFISEYLKAN